MSLWDNLHDDRGMVKLEDGSLCERDVLNIITQIYEMDPNIKVQYLERAAQAGDAPWRIIERCKDGEWRVIFYAWQMDARVLDRLRMADAHANDILGALDSNNDAVRLREGRRFRERLDEAQDLTLHILKSPKGRYSFKDGEKLVEVDDDPKPSWKVDGKYAGE